MTGATPFASGSRREARRTFWFDLGAVLLLGCLVIVGLSVGRYPMAPSDVATIVWMKLTGTTMAVPQSAETVLFQVRGPRIVAATVIGAALAAAGAAYQGMFRNPLVSPDILGVSAGAGLGAVLAIFLSLSVLAIQGFAFAEGIVAVAAVYFVGSSVRGHDPILALILAGVVIGTLLGACIALLKYLADPYN
jgi:iron complex transport system permease protein